MGRDRRQWREVRAGQGHAAVTHSNTDDKGHGNGLHDFLMLLPSPLGALKIFFLDILLLLHLLSRSKAHQHHLIHRGVQ